MIRMNEGDELWEWLESEESESTEGAVQSPRGRCTLAGVAANS